MSTYREEDLVEKKNKSDIVTPYRLSLAILIRNFHHFRESGNGENGANGFFHEYLRNFCVLLVKLTQSPDLELGELWNLLISQDNKLPESLITSFKQDLIYVNEDGVGTLLDIIDSLSRVLSINETYNLTPRNKYTISKMSVVGFYLRRLMINFDRLTLSEVTEIYRSLQRYFKCLPTLHPSPNRIEFCVDSWSGDKNLWTRRQAELFIATQAALVENNEEKAMNPKELQIVMSNIFRTNPNLAEAHFLTYLNYLRVKEFCGAIDSLYHCFDLNKTGDVKTHQEDKIRIGRFAALNLAVLHFHFDHQEESLSSLREAIRIAQDADDNLCIQHALSWLFRFIVTNGDKRIEQSILKSFGLSLSYSTSLGIQLFVQLSCLLSAKPHHIFETLSKSDIINYEQNHRDLISNSYAVKSSLWQFYGKPEMSALWSQLLMYLNIDNPKPSLSYYGESFCLSLCNVTLYLLTQGSYNLVYCLLNFAATRYPNEPNCGIWMLCEGIFNFTRALYHEDWNEAEAAAQKILIVDKWESFLRLAELNLNKQDYVKANEFVNMIFERYVDEDTFKFKGYQFIRCKMILAEIQLASHLPQSIPPGIMNLLSTCLIETNKYQLDYYSALIYLHIANLQLHLKMVGQSLAVMEKSMVQVMAHGGCYDRARCLLLYAKCLIASSNGLSGNERVATMKEGLRTLNEVKEVFEKIEAISRVKDVVYLQARLYSDLNMKHDRNRCALEFRLLDEEHKTKNLHTLFKYF